VVYILNKKTSKSPLVMSLIRKLVLLTNLIADSISHCQWKKFRELAPKSSPVPLQLPSHVWKI